MRPTAASSGRTASTHHALVPPQRLVRNPVSPGGARLGRGGPGRPARGTRQERPLHTAGPALPPHGAAAGGQGGSGVTRANLTIASTHDHSSPYYSSTSWGAWAFQDVYDVRFFDYYAEAHGRAVERAARNLKPVRVGASVSTVRQDPPPLLGPAVGRRRHPGRLSTGRHRPRPDRTCASTM